MARTPEVRDSGVASALVAVSHAALSEGIRSMLSLVVPTVVLVADVGSLLAAASRLRPDVAVVELGLPDGDGLDVVRHLRERAPATRVILIDPHGLPESTRRKLAAEASAVVPVTEIGARLLPAVDAALAESVSSRRET